MLLYVWVFEKHCICVVLIFFVICNLNFWISTHHFQIKLIFSNKRSISFFKIPGIRQFSATLRSRISLKSEDDLPPPYDEEAFAQEIDQGIEQQSPPPYHVAISMNSENSPEINCQNQNDQDENEDDEDLEISTDETDSKVNFAAKKKAKSSKSPKISWHSWKFLCYFVCLNLTA